MRKVCVLILAFLMVSAAALADVDLSSMSVDDLVQLRQGVDHELAHRILEDETVQAVAVGDLSFTLHQAVVGYGRDDRQAVAIVFTVANASDATKSLMADVEYTITQNGTLLESTPIKAEGYTGPSVIDSMSAKIKPGASDMQLCVAGLLADGGGDRIEIDLYDKHAPRDVDPFCGTFVVDLSELQ